MESGIRRHAESPDSRRGLVVGGTVVNRSPGRKSGDSGPLGETAPGSPEGDDRRRSYRGCGRS
jgi:hypothetical protein